MEFGIYCVCDPMLMLVGKERKNAINGDFFSSVSPSVKLCTAAGSNKKQK
jgi:hypothetical protein